MKKSNDNLRMRVRILLYRVEWRHYRFRIQRVEAERHFTLDIWMDQEGGAAAAEMLFDSEVRERESSGDSSAQHCQILFQNVLVSSCRIL